MEKLTPQEEILYTIHALNEVSQQIIEKREDSDYLAHVLMLQDMIGRNLERFEKKYSKFSGINYDSTKSKIDTDDSA